MAVMDSASWRIGKQRGEAGAARAATAVPDFAAGPVIVAALLLAALLIAFSGRYGYHRDELYFLACGRRLAWGYPDQPPLVPVIARLVSGLAPASLVVLRLPSAVASAVLVLLTGLIARELGAERAAPALAAARSPWRYGRRTSPGRPATDGLSWPSPGRSPAAVPGHRRRAGHCCRTCSSWPGYTCRRSGWPAWCGCCGAGRCAGAAPSAPPSSS